MPAVWGGDHRVLRRTCWSSVGRPVVVVMSAVLGSKMIFFFRSQMTVRVSITNGMPRKKKNVRDSTIMFCLLKALNCFFSSRFYFLYCLLVLLTCTQMSLSGGQWGCRMTTVRKCKSSRPSWSPDGRCILLQSAHKGDIIARAGWDKATAFGVLQSPPFPIAPILSHSILPDYPPLPHCPIIPLQQQANLSVQLGSRLPSCCVI